MRNSQFDTITTSVYFNEDDRVWCWELRIGTRKAALDKVNDWIEAAL